MSPATTKKQSENSGAEKGRSKVRGDKSVKILHNLAPLYKVQTYCIMWGGFAFKRKVFHKMSQCGVLVYWIESVQLSSN